MSTYIIVLIVLLIIVIVSLLCFVFLKKNKVKEESVVEEKSNYNESDVKTLQNINGGLFTAKKVQSSPIKTPQFKAGEPIGYTDTSHVLNNTGDHIANQANRE